MTKKFKLQPMGDRVVVEMQSMEEQTASGIVLMSSTQSDELPGAGTVVAVGEKATSKDGAVASDYFKVGDSVYFNKYAGDDVEIDKKTYRVLRLDSIFGFKA